MNARATCGLTLRFDVVGNPEKASELIMVAAKAGFEAEIVPTRTDGVHDFEVTIHRPDGSWAHGTLAAALHLCALADGKDVKVALGQWLKQGLPADIRPDS